MKGLNIDYINLLLIIIAFALAIMLPFKLFLLAYAILGPLHYFTEINWIRDKNYFVDISQWKYTIIVAATLIAIPYFYKIEIFKPLLEIPSIKSLIFTLSKYSNAIYFISLVCAGALIFSKTIKTRLTIILSGIILAILLHHFTFYQTVIGILLPTIIHVYVFTIMFMLYGTLKTTTTVGVINIILLLAVPFILSLITIDNTSFLFSDQIKKLYLDNNFHVLNANLSKLIGTSDGTTFFFYEISDLKIQMFISFAYTYHYLNWFSKTTIIGWHKKLTQKKSVIIIALWIAAVLLYFYDYKLGLTIVLFFSLLHVLLEFPLNMISIKSILNSVTKRI